MTDHAAQLNIEEQLVRIARAREESEKFIAEQHKLMAEERKFAAEERKLFAEALKLQRDHGLAPWLVAIGGIGGVAGFAAATVTALKSLGVL